MASRSASPAPLPRLDHPDLRIAAWAEQLVRAVQIELQRIASAAGPTAYTLTAATPNRSLNPTTTTLPELAENVAALVTDLKTKGFIA